MIARIIRAGGAAARLPLFFCAIAAACFGAPGVAEPAGAADRTIVVVAMPSSGARPAIAEAMMAAVAAARPHATLDIETEDDWCTDAGAQRIADRVLDRRRSGAPIAAVIGHPCAAAARAAAARYRSGPVLFAPVAPLFVDARSNSREVGETLILIDGSEPEGAFLGRIAASADGAAPRIAVVSDATRSMREIARDAIAAATARNAAPVVVETIAAGTRDLNPVAQRLAAASVSRIILAAFPAEAWLLIDALQRAGLAPTVLAPAALAGEAPPPDARDAAARVMVARPAVPGEDRAAPAGDPGATRAHALTSIALQVVAAAVGATPAQRPRGADLAAALRDVTVPTTHGPVTFDAGGRSDLPLWQFLSWHGSRWAPAR